MSNNKIFFDNVLYAEAFLHHLLDHPEDAERIPENAVIMFSREDRDPGLSATNRLVVKTPEVYRGRTVIPVGVKETRESGCPYQFLFPWTGSDVWIRFNETPLIQEVLSAAVGVQEENPTRYFIDRALHVVPRLVQSPAAKVS